ncbi:AUGMIN subunit 2 [Stylosanthes scabra]|uniref:AUGMIN subunit 2 n=1 Tax=Stylosanthes scabra TaxID=79078 RepID=A0ABU6RD75_9FABA|nr:AUGMIN subunit 2 [Stylosanthes scabra]
MSTGSSESNWVGRSPRRRIGGMSDALSIAADLGFTVSPLTPTQSLKISSPTPPEKGQDDLVTVLRELSSVQRKIVDLQVELQNRKNDKDAAHLTHVSEMEKKIETLATITAILKDVIQKKDRIVARLQQPYSLYCIHVEAEYQKEFAELLMKAASDYGVLTESVADLQWSQNFKDPPSVWGEMLRPIPVALASCTRFLEAMSATRESFAALQKLRVDHFESPLPRTPGSTPSQRLPAGDSDFLSPPHWKSEANFNDLAAETNRDNNQNREASDVEILGTP